jgi:hypothetical protein
MLFSMKGAQMSAPGEITASDRPSTTWLGSCAAVCLTILAYGYLSEKEASRSLAYLLGYNFPIAIFIAGGLHVAFRKRESKRTSWLGFFVIYVALVASSLLASNKQREELKTAASEIDRTVLATMSSRSDAPTSPPPLTSTAPVAGGEAGRMEATVKTMLNRSAAARREYELELNAIGWSDVLSGKRLQRDSALSESRTMLRQARTVVAKYSGRTNELFEELRRDIETADLNPASKRSMLEGFDKSTDQHKEKAAELWPLEQQVLAQFENIFNLLSARRAAWQVQNDQVLFNAQADLDLFNSYLAKVSQLVAKQEELQAASLQRTRQAIQSLAGR